jgi:proline iminopeptidase
VAAAVASAAQPACNCPIVKPVTEGYVDVEGGRVWYRKIGSGSRTPLVMLHGGPGATSYYLEPLASVLADERVVVLYDQLGCGRSDRPSDRSLFNVARFERELMQVRRTLEIDRAVLLGHSWGGQLAVEHTLAHPSEVVGLVLASPSLSIPRTVKDLARLRARLPQPLQDTLAKHEADGTIDAKEYTDAVAELYRRHVILTNPMPDAVANSFRNLGADVYNHMWGPNEFNAIGTLRSYDISPRLHELALPVLFTAGREDEIVPEAVEWYRSLVPRAKIHVFERAAHMTMSDRPDESIAVLRQFLKDVDAEKG